MELLKHLFKLVGKNVELPGNITLIYNFQLNFITYFLKFNVIYKKKNVLKTFFN